MTATVSGQWTSPAVTGDVPLGRSSSAVGVVASTLYVFSGEHTPRNPADGDIHALSLSTGVWKRYARTDGWPAARVGHAAAVHNGKLYIYGGRGSASSDNTFDDLWVLDPSRLAAGGAEMWTQLTPAEGGARPPPLSYHAMASDGANVLIYGGCLPEGRSNALWAYDPVSNSWQKREISGAEEDSQPVPRGGPCLVNTSDGVHLLYGYSGKTELRDHWRWSAAESRWQPVANSEEGPEARSVTDAVFLSGVGARGSIFIFGGEYTPSAQGHDGAGSYHGDAWLFDIAASRWQRMADTAGAPSARGWGNATAVDAKSIAVFGGFDGTQRLGDVYVWIAAAAV